MFPNRVENEEGGVVIFMLPKTTFQRVERMSIVPFMPIRHRIVLRARTSLLLPTRVRLSSVDGWLSAPSIFGQHSLRSRSRRYFS